MVPLHENKMQILDCEEAVSITSISVTGPPVNIVSHTSFQS